MALSAIEFVLLELGFTQSGLEGRQQGGRAVNSRHERIDNPPCLLPIPLGQPDQLYADELCGLL